MPKKNFPVLIILLVTLILILLVVWWYNWKIESLERMGNASLANNLQTRHFCSNAPGQ